MLRKTLTTLILPVLIGGAALAQTADELIAKNIAARGGLDRLKAVNTIRVTGKSFMQGLEAPSTIRMKRPNKVRTEFTIQGKTMVQAYDGETAWAIMPFMGKTDPEKMTAEDAKEVTEEADIDGPLVDYKAKGHTVELIGKEDMEGTPVHKLKVTLKAGGIRYVYLDADHFLEVKSTMKRMTQGAEMEIDTYYSDFKPVDSLMIPHAIESKVKGQTAMQIRVDSVKFNVDLADSLFKMPPKTAAAPEDTTKKVEKKAGEKP